MVEQKDYSNKVSRLFQKSLTAALGSARNAGEEFVAAWAGRSKKSLALLRYGEQDGSGTEMFCRDPETVPTERQHDTAVNPRLCTQSCVGSSSWMGRRPRSAEGGGGEKGRRGAWAQRGLLLPSMQDVVRRWRMVLFLWIRQEAQIGHAQNEGSH